MVCLKKRRTEMMLTQQQLAEKVNTTEQEIGRWENGKTEIPSPALKDLALVLNCTIEDVLGTSTTNRSFYATSISHHINPKTTGLYGGIMLDIKGIEEDLEFPIDRRNYQFIDRFFTNSEDDGEPKWLVLETLDNWILFINLEMLVSLETYDDDVQKSPEFEHPEVIKPSQTHWS